ncbi:MAG: ABC transporter ATP-binding protein [Halofilum sp. (in: g-proteobacteria)]|nr:ABC transporter ATP-binding protein [Halofilum sp. (in: g-proteobacteria)]
MIETEHLTKRFDVLTAVDDLTLRVEPGEVLGFLGPNGAGKSTTMKMIAGFLAPSAGSARVCGHDVVADAAGARAALGYLPEGAPAYGEMVPWSFLVFVARLRGLRGAERRARLDAVIEQLHLGPVLQQPIATLSKGFKRRVGLAQALLHDPPALILDEPTDGLDPNQKHEVRALINAIAPAKTIVISTHILEEVESVCTRAAIISDGRLVADEHTGGAARALALPQRGHGRARRAGAGRRRRARRARRRRGVERAPDGHSLTVFGRDGLDTAERVRACAGEHGWTVAALRAEGGRLDDVFRAITRGSAETAA